MTKRWKLCQLTARSKQCDSSKKHEKLWKPRVDILESRPVVGGRRAGGVGDGYEQDETEGRPSRRDDEYEQPCLYVERTRP